MSRSALSVLSVSLVSVRALAAPCLAAPVQQTPTGLELNKSVALSYPTFTNAFGVRAVGDVDNDGSTDIAVGSIAFTNPNVKIVSAKDGSLIHDIFVPTGFPLAAASAGPAGDFDNDGHDDVLVSISDENVFVYSGLDASTLVTLAAPPQSSFGASTGPAGNINGDAFDDILVGAPFLGYVQIHAGPSGALIQQLQGTSPGDGFGWQVLGMGDVDGDSFDDFAVMAHLPLLGIGGYFDVYSGQARTLLYRITFNPVLKEGKLITIEDVDGDGVRDLAFGIISQSGSTPGEIRVYSSATGALLNTIVGPAGSSHVRFGIFLEDIGDFDADGASDFMVHVPDPGVQGSGYFQIRSGNGFGVLRTFGYAHPLGSNSPVHSDGLGDLNGDGRAEFCIQDFAMPATPLNASLSIFGIERTTISTQTVSASLGGTVRFDFDYRASGTILLLGSLTGNSGAVVLGYPVPLTPDAYYQATFTAPNYNVVLDDSGSGSITVTIPPNTLPVGATVYHAPIRIDPSTFPLLDVRTEAITFTIVP